MRLLDEIMQANREFLDSGSQFPRRHKEPRRKIAIFTCMDARLVELLEPAMGIHRGDAHILKNAGNTLAHPTGGVVRSLVVSVYALEVSEILVVGHLDCGMAGLSIPELRQKMLERGIHEDHLDGLDDLHEWIGAFSDPVENVHNVVRLLRGSPLIPPDVPVHGVIVEPNRGALTVLVDGYSAVGDD